MTLGPIEVLVIGFPENKFNGKIIPELLALIEQDIINVVDGLLIKKDDDGTVEFIEFDQTGLDDSLSEFKSLLADTVHDLVSDEDVDEFARGLAPGSSGAVLVFEHTWAKPFRDAIVDSGGFMVANFRVPGLVVEEVLAAAAATK
jgi:hypothetical protein